MGSEEEFYLSGNDESQMEEVFEYKAESILLSVDNREPLKFPEQQSVIVRADKLLGKKRIRCVEH